MGHQGAQRVVACYEDELVRGTGGDGGDIISGYILHHVVMASGCQGEQLPLSLPRTLAGYIMTSS